MLKVNRRGVIIFICTLLLSGLSSANVLLDMVVAVVNQDVITWSELYKAMEADASPEVKKMSKDEKRRVLKQNEALFLETLINVKLQLQEADKMGVRVSDAEVKEAIDSIKKKYSMSDAAFTESLKGEGFTFEEYKKRLQQQIIISKTVNALIKSKIVITDEEVNIFMAENMRASENSESFRISQILLKRQKDVDNSRIEERADDLYNKIKQGESFFDLARQYSEDSSAKAGGDLGLLKKSQLNSKFIDVLSRMQPGDISKPFWSESGLHIIKLESKEAAKSRDEQREEAKLMLSNKIFAERYNAWIKSLREKSFIEIRL